MSTDALALANTANTTIAKTLDGQGWQAIGTMGVNLSFPMVTIPGAYGQSTQEIFGLTTYQGEQFNVAVPKIKILHANYASTTQITANAATGEAPSYTDYILSGRFVDAVNGVSSKLRWAGENNTALTQWGIKISDEIAYQTTPGLFVTVETCLLANTSNAFTPIGKNFAGTAGGVALYSNVGSNPGDKTKGAAPAISIAGTANQGFYHSLVLGFTGASPIKNVLILGDSNLVSLGDAGCLHGGWAARMCLGNSSLSITQANQGTPLFPFLNTSKQGESSYGFALDAQHKMRVGLAKWFSTVIYAYGTNDVAAGLSLAQMQAAILKMAAVFTLQGKNFIACTVPPTSSTTNSWLYNANLASVQTVGTNDSVRTAYNTWLRSGFVAASGCPANLVKVFDQAAVIEVNASNVLTLNGGYTRTPAAGATPYYSGSVTTAGSNQQLTDTGLSATVNLYRGMVLVVTSGANAGSVAGIGGNSATKLLQQNTGFGSNYAIGDTYQIWGPTAAPYKQDAYHLTGPAHAAIAAAFSQSLVQ